MAKGIELTAQLVEAEHVERSRSCVQHHLQRGESLLTVDDGPCLHRTVRAFCRLDHDGPEEVGSGCTRLGALVLGQAPNFLPERIPLVLLVQHVWALEQGHHPTAEAA